MDLVHESARQLENLQPLSTDPAATRAEKLEQRVEVARRLCDALDGRELDAGTCHAAASALMTVHARRAEFIERAEQLARTAWQRGYPESGLLYARLTDRLCNLRRQRQRYGTLTYVRHGELVLQLVDPEVGDDERAGVGLPTLAEMQADIAQRNRRAAEEVAKSSGLPEGVEIRRVWQAEDPARLLARRDVGGPVWQEGEDLVFVWQGEAEEVNVGGGIQMPMWRVDHSDVWILRLRIRDLDRAVIGYGFVRTNSEPPRPPQDQGCWRGSLMSEPLRCHPVAGELRALSLPGPGADERHITVYLPPGHDPASTYPVVYLADGHMTGSLAEVLDAAVQRGDVPPVVLVGVACGTAVGQDMRADEYLLGIHPQRFDAHQRFFVSDVAAFAESELGASTERHRRFIFGVSNGAAFAVAMGLQHPERFGGVLAFSLGMPPTPTPSWPPGGVPGHYLVAGTLEEGFRRSTAKWADAVRAAGGDCGHVEMVSGHDFRMWEQQFPVAVAWATERGRD